MKTIKSLMNPFGVGTLCFLIGIASFSLCSRRRFENPTSIVTSITKDSVMQVSSLDVDSSCFHESVMAELQDSVRRTMHGYKFSRANCRCPGIIFDQQSMSYGILMRSASFGADVYIAESRSSKAAKEWLAARSKVNADQLLITPKLEAVWLKNDTGRDLMVLIRIDKFVFQISGEAAAVKSLAKVVLDRLSAS